jgi:hypothetical protein
MKVSPESGEKIEKDVFQFLHFFFGGGIIKREYKKLAKLVTTQIGTQ